MNRWDGVRDRSVVRFFVFAAAGLGACTGQIGPPLGPPSPNIGCTELLTPPTQAFVNTGLRNGEFSVAYDPRPTSAQGAGNTYVYAAAQELTLDPGTPFPSCILAKKTVVYFSDRGGQKGTWKLAGGNKDLPGANNAAAQFARARLSQGQVWATDQIIKVASDGTVFLSILEMAPFSSCADPTTLNNAPFNQVDIFTSAPGAGSFRGLVVTDDSERVGNRTTGPVDFYDHPTMAVNLTDPTQAVVFYTIFQGTMAERATEFRTVRRAADGSISVVGKQTESALRGFSALAFDEFGKLYSAGGNLQVIQSTWNASTAHWDPSPIQGGPTSVLYHAPVGNGIPLDSQGTLGAFPDETPALAVGTLGQDTEPSVFLEYEVPNPTNSIFPLVQISRAFASQIGSPAGWGAPARFPSSPDSISVFHPALALDPVANMLDAIVMATQPAGSPQATIINTFWARFDPTQLAAAPVGPQSLATNAPTAGDLPAREPFTLVKNLGTRFAGEYNGLAVQGETPVFAYLERPSAQVTSLGIGFISPQCHTAQFSSLLSGDTWECACSCQDQQTLTSRVSKVQGCEPIDSSANQVCADLCPGRADGIAPFSPAVVCGTSASTGPARFVAANTCRATDGRPPGGLVTDFGDLMATGGTASTVTIHRGGAQFATAIGGTVSANLSGRPAAGTKIELARMNLTAQPFSAGAFGTVHDIGISQKSRFAGTFTDATHFVIPPVAGQLDVSSIVTPVCTGGTPCDDVDNAAHEVNFNPITGVLDLAARRLSFDIAESDGPDNTIGVHFDGTVTQLPVDTDADGVLDPADNCPLIANPTQQRVASPRVVAPSARTISVCSNASIGQPTVTDSCGAGGIVVTNNAPAQFPLGQTVVTWSARDARGNVGTATQTITATLVDDASCCPAGMNVIRGTAGNDVLVGTAGPDCIFGLGGQDQISGLGGNDLLSGGDGDDTIDGGSGNDRIYGGPGQDHLIGGTGDDLLDGGDGVDLIEGGAGNDTLFGGNGGDHLLGGDGNDQLHGDADDDTLEAGLGTDLLDGGANNDICVAGSGGTKTFVSCETKR